VIHQVILFTYRAEETEKIKKPIKEALNLWGIFVYIPLSSLTTSAVCMFSSVFLTVNGPLKQKPGRQETYSIEQSM